MKTYYVYILERSDKTYYTGITSNLIERFESHKAGKYKDSYTSSRGPLKLVFSCEFTNPTLAVETEKRIKKWSRTKKLALIKGDYDVLPS